ncbi:site-2 protease family protein [Patescibacteria group bacterium]|nr:site-2 protease family protein [Patescibacteria group bacterium]
MIVVFSIIVLIFSAVIHEVMHGVVANHLGDPTARLMGRLTLNPLKHLDPFGSVILPLLLALVPGGIIFGWAKPVPYNPYNLKDPEKGAAMIAAAGPFSNLGIAVVFAVIFRLIVAFGAGAFMVTLAQLIETIVVINIILGIFNLVPIPPLDGAKVAMAFMPDSWGGFKMFFRENNPYGWFILVAFIFFGFALVSPIIYGLAGLLLGI